MSDPCGRNVDPRVLRTRQLLQRALETLLTTRGFDELSVQDIAVAATVNRATFYAHYPDKFALLECMVAGQFHGLLAARGVTFDGTCSQALKAIIVSVCDFLVGGSDPASAPPRRIEPQVESAIIAVVRGMMLDGLRRHSYPDGTTPEMLAGTASWAIYGGVKEWFQTGSRVSSDDAADTVLRLVNAILTPLPAPLVTERDRARA